MIGLVIVSVECFFANCDGSFDCEGVIVIDGGSGQVFVDVIHGRYDSGDAGCPSGEKQSRIFEYLHNSESD